MIVQQADTAPSLRRSLFDQGMRLGLVHAFSLSARQLQMNHSQTVTALPSLIILRMRLRRQFRVAQATSGVEDFAALWMRADVLAPGAGLQVRAACGRSQVGFVFTCKGRRLLQT